MKPIVGHSRKGRVVEKEKSSEWNREAGEEKTVGWAGCRDPPWCCHGDTSNSALHGNEAWVTYGLGEMTVCWLRLTSCNEHRSGGDANRWRGYICREGGLWIIPALFNKFYYYDKNFEKLCFWKFSLKVTWVNGAGGGSVWREVRMCPCCVSHTLQAGTVTVFQAGLYVENTLEDRNSFMLGKTWL